MRKVSLKTDLINKDFTADNYSISSKAKTTNINILLNRVRIDKKRDLQKKLIFLSLLVLTIGFIAILATV